MHTDDRRVVLLTLLAQTGAALVVAAFSALWGPVAAVSALLGGLAAVVPNGFLAARLLSGPAQPGAKALMRSAWVGEIGKLLLTVLAFGAIFALVRPISVPAVFAGFIGAQAAVFGALLIGATGSATARTKS